MRLRSAGLILSIATGVFGQTPEVPHKMAFAGMSLTIRDDARREIQEDVNALTRNPRYFDLKVDRARQYFPIIERIFREERVPDEFKYLALQESALIADAISVSNAVGYWQFKDFTAREVGLRIDNAVDERKNIVSSTRGAARYLKQNNFVFNNWILALQAYQMGAGGVKRAVGDEFDGDRHMHITSATYWYVKKFLAHLVAFSHALQTPGSVPPLREVVVNCTCELATLARDLAVDVQVLADHNKWILASVLPADKPYTLIVPEAATGPAPLEVTPAVEPVVAKTPQPPVTATPTPLAEPLRVYGVPAIMARQDETLPQLVARSGIGLSQFLDFNDIEIDHLPHAGVPYFMDRKNHQAPEPQHPLAVGEDVWRVSQQYAVQLRRLRKFNRLKPDEAMQAGDVVWLNATRPKITRETAPAEVAELDPGSWITLPEGPENQPNITRVGDPAHDLHVVQKSETLYSIARQYGVTVQELMDWNGKKDTALAPGEQLKVQGR